MSAGRYKHYELQKLLGRGIAGEVYVARHTIMENKVALRFLPRELTADEEIKGPLLAEARNAIGLKDPRIAQLHSIEEDGGVFVLCMEYVAGKTLAAALSGRRVPLVRARRIAITLASALVVAHRKGLLHRNLHPGNVMIASDETLKLMDLGLRLPRGVDISRGTPHQVAFLAPEQVRGGQPVAASDVWSFGVVLHWLLTGVLPFDGPDAQAVIRSILTESPVRPRELQKGVPIELDRLVQSCLRRDPTERPASMKAISDALRGRGAESGQAKQPVG